ncbi:MAG: hypothetical protein GBAus27B_000012 [Mycoplasmataceae bacterium]|nr:MAG: hypothetical protein GBAus27B_000012 [Mycoplasmataceae bacterium]
MISKNLHKLRKDASVEAWKESKTNNSLFNTLNGFEKDTSKKDAWEAVNSYKKRWEKDK